MKNWPSWHIAIYLILFSIVAHANETCMSSSKTCSFYQCAEKEKNCGKRGYLLRKGYRFCKKFGKKAHKLTYNGQAWVNNVRYCLQKNLQGQYQSLSCREIKKSVWAHHLSCYYDQGFCQLSKKDRLKIYNVVGISILQPNFIKVAFKLFKKCRETRDPKSLNIDEFNSFLGQNL